MPRLRLYGDARSGNCYKVALLLRLTRRPFEWLQTDVFEKHTRTPEFLAMNPNGRVPLLEWPDGRRLAESNAMLLYLGEGTSFVPADPWKRAQVWQWLFFEQYSHEPYIAVARFLALCGRLDAEAEAERVAGLHEQGYQALAVMESALGEAGGFVGSDLSVADISLYAYTHRAGDGGFDLDGYPRIRRWLSRVEETPGFLPMEAACRTFDGAAE